VWQLTGRPISVWQQQWAPGGNGSPTTPAAAFWLDLPRPELYGRINRRVEHMVAGGLVEEVRTLRQLPRPLSREATQALGYKEMFDYLDGRATLAETVTRIQTRTRNFAKRQITWFRHLPGCRPVQPEPDMTIDICRLTIDNTN
jgi:tRNA dimethylallyltransferase